MGYCQLESSNSFDMIPNNIVEWSFHTVVLLLSRLDIKSRQTFTLPTATIAFGWDVGGGACVLSLGANGLSVIALIRQENGAFLRRAQQGLRLGSIIHLAFGQV